MEKSKVDGNVSFSGHISHGLASSTGENKTSVHNPRDAEVSTVLSERFHSAQQTSVRSDLRSETGQTSNGKRKEPDYSSVTAEVCHESHTNKGPDHNKLLKTDSASSKESGEVVQLSSVDSTDPKPCQSSNEDLVERKPFLTQSHESKIVFLEHESSVVTTKSDSTAISLQSSRHCNFDLNEGMEENGAEFHKIPPISVVAKVGVPMGLPQKPLQFGGELGWKRSGNISAFRSTSFMNSERGSITNSNRGFDLNVAATMDSEYPGEETSVDFTSKQPEKFLLDLNCQSASDVNHHKASASSFDLNDNPVIEDTQNYIHHNQHSENQQLLRKSVAANTATCFRGNASQSNFELGRPSYWVDLSSMRGFSHVQPHPFLVAAPTAEQVQMMIPSGLYIGKHGAAALPQISGSVLAAYPGAVQFLESPQGLNPHALANMRPTFFPNGSIPLMENGSRGFGTPELLIPLKNGFFEARERPVEQVALPPSQINYRQMASWN
uniref:Uncharacterized protein n=1 Tax=Chenopodium quinoa TaxID=63459 RepID=A0A803NF46_CHEQI